MATIDLNKDVLEKNSSLPQIEDFYYNDIYGYGAETLNESNVFYREEPPGGPDFLGFNSDNTLLSLDATDAIIDKPELFITNAIDGDTILVDLAKVKYKDIAAVKDKIDSYINEQSFKKYLVQNNAYDQTLYDTNALGSTYEVRFLFMDAAETPHYRVKNVLGKYLYKRPYITVKDKLNFKYSAIPYPYQNYVTCNSYAALITDAFTNTIKKSYSDDDKILFYCSTEGTEQKIKDAYGLDDGRKYIQAILVNDEKEIKPEKSYSIMYLSKNEDTAKASFSAYQAKHALLQMLSKAQEVRLVVSLTENTSMAIANNYFNVEAKTISKGDPEDIIGNAISDLKNNLLNTRWYKTLGFSISGLDVYHRILGVIFVKVNGEWINLNKYIIQKSYEFTETGSTTNSADANYYLSSGPEVLRPYTYDYKNTKFVDNFWSEAKKFEDKRVKTQESIFNAANVNLYPGEGKTNSDVLYEWTVSIGDTTFFVPPASIKVTTQTDTKRLPLIRSRGSMTKGAQKSQQYIQIDLFFNEDRGINGFEYTETCPDNKTKYTSYMNGLRALIAEMKFTPYLPIINRYINEVLGIEAVFFEAINIQTVPGFPRLIKATLVLGKFNYHVFMPQIPYSDNESTKAYENPFAACIDYQLMRYYYQAPLRLGNELAKRLNATDNSKLTVNDKEFFQKTIFSNRTALIPCQFVNPNIDVYLANEDYLKELLSIKRNAMKKNASDNFIANNVETHLINNFTDFNKAIDIDSIYVTYVNKAKKLLEAINLRANNVIECDGATVDIYNDKITYLGVTYNSLEGKECNNFLIEYLYKPMNIEISSKIADLKDSDGQNIIANNGLDRWMQVYYINFNIVCLRSEYKLLRDESLSKVKERTQPFEIADSDYFAAGAIKLRISYVEDSDYNTECGYNALASALSRLAACVYDEGKISIDADVEKGLYFVKWCATYAADTSFTNKKVSDLKQSIDWEDMNTIKFDLFIKDALVTDFAATLCNTFTKLTASADDDISPQYLGGQDVKLSWAITTKDEGIVSKFKSLPALSAYYIRNYRQVISTCAIKIDSEFTRMIGVNEINIDSVSVETTERFPGVFTIRVNATSVDRTMRNKEALRLLEQDNQGLSYGEMRKQIKIRHFMNINAELAKAELYPDLELPTVKDLGKLGWRFLRYRNKERDESNYFIDPDFYFVYPNSTMARALLAAIDTAFNDSIPDDSMTTINVDNQGGISKFSKKTGGYIKGSGNDIVNRRIKDREKQVEELKKNDALGYVYKQLPLLVTLPFGCWSVSKNIQCTFLESYYYKDYLASTQKIKTTDNLNEVDLPKGEVLFKKIDTMAKEIYDYLTNNAIKESDINEGSRKYAIQDFVSQNIIPILRKNGLLGTTLYDSNYSLTTNGELLKSIINIFLAAADALTSACEYNESTNQRYYYPKAANGEDSYNTKIAIWKTNEDYVGLTIDQKVISDTKEFNIDDMIKFGVYNIGKYNYSEFMKVLPQDEAAKIKVEESGGKTFVIDPYYRTKQDEQKEYLTKCASNSRYCAVAFCRNAMWYMYLMMKNYIMPSIEYDFKRESVNDSIKASESAESWVKSRASTTTTKDNSSDNQSDEAKQSQENVAKAQTMMKSIRAFMEANGRSFDAGKFFAPVILAILEEGFGNNSMYDLFFKRNYKELNKIVRVVMTAKYNTVQPSVQTFKNRQIILRKFLLALVGYGEITSKDYLSRANTANPPSMFLNACNETLSLKACNDPNTYMRDSFFDMCRFDCRGRMLRAFPTFYMLFLDEGREVGLWKLHDNFYNTNAIHDIQIVKSRKIPADTCIITLSNMFQTFTTNDEDATINYKGNWGILFDNIFNQKQVAEDAELRRLAAYKINRAKLQPGIRIHVRLGYGSNAAEIPGVFNGVIAEVQPGETVKIIAQGDGVELCNPLFGEKDADIMLNNDNFVTIDSKSCGAPASEILSAYLTTKGGPVAAAINGAYRSNIDIDANINAEQYGRNSSIPFGPITAEDSFIMQMIKKMNPDNPFGLKHFGDPYNTSIFTKGEPVQNIYEVTLKYSSMFNDDIENSVNNKAYYGDTRLDIDNGLGEDSLLTGKNVPYISFKPFGKTIWEIMHICQSINPDFVTGIRDFGFRSTIFLGRPHYYYAYAYDLEKSTLQDTVDGNQAIYEKRKPFQQYHIYNSFNDIITNHISASSEKIKTNAVGLFEIDSSQKTDPIWVDQEIYPEYQKSMIVDTKLYGKSWVRSFLGPLADIGDKVVGLFGDLKDSVLDKYLETAFDTDGKLRSHRKLAENMTINALKDSVKEMYQGSIVVFGDPSVKPNDRMIINDVYEDMNGMCEIREVVHTLNPFVGFTTTITPDCISANDGASEMIKQNKGAVVAQYVRLAVMQGVGRLIDKKVLNIGDKVAGKLSEEAIKRTKIFTETLGKKGLTKGVENLKNSGFLKTLKDVKTLIKDAKIVYGARWASIARNLLGGPVTIALTLGMAGINSFLYRTIKYSQTLRIFPLMKFGMPLTAGVDGQQGLVYGSAQFNNVGPLKAFYAKFSPNNPENGLLWNMILLLLVDDDVQQEADKFIRDAKYISAAKNMSNENEIATYLQTQTGPVLMDTMYQPRSAFAMSLVPRVAIANNKQIKQIIRTAVESKTYIKLADDWMTNPNLKNLHMVKDSLELKRLFDCGILKIVQDMGTIDSAYLTEYTIATTRDTTTKIVGVKQKEGNNEIVDVPLLTTEGIVILKEICEFIIAKIGLKLNGSAETTQYLKDSHLILTSAERIGSKNYLYGSGHHFVLTAVGQLKDKLKTYVTEYRTDLENKLNTNSGTQKKPLFDIEDSIKAENEVGIQINPLTPFGNNNVASKKDSSDKDSSNKEDYKYD